MKIKNILAFTLIELLIVISIIGILATLLMANINASRERARDAQRKADLRNIQTALRIYYNDYSGYPTSSGGLIVGCGTAAGAMTCSWGGGFVRAGRTYMSILPADPLPSQSYNYIQSDSDTYVLSACLENRSDPKCMGSADWCEATTGCVYTVQP